MLSTFSHIYRRVASAALLLVVVVATAIPLRAQLPMNNPNLNNQPNVLGSNTLADPNEGQEGENPQQEQQDTTKEKKIRKPLESYFFNDSIRALNNFRWSVKRDKNKVQTMPLDTAITDFRVDYPFYKDGVGDMALGGLGQSSQPINYFAREQYQDFSFAQSYDAYLFDMENTAFTNVKSPFTQLSYSESGQKRYREVNFGLSHAQNISPTTGFNLDYKSRGTEGLYTRQKTGNQNLALNFAHTGKYYSVHAAYINNKIETEENGGAVALWAVRDTIFEKPEGIPTKLAEAEAANIYRNNAFFVNQSLAIPLEPVTDMDYSLAHLAAIYIGHSFEYNRWTKLYTDVRSKYTDDRADKNEDGTYKPETYEYYDNWYINPAASRDTLSETVISNRFYVEAQPWSRDGAVGTINGGIGIDHHTYSQFGFDSYLSGRLTKDKRTSWFGYGSVDGKIKKYVDWGADLKVYPSGYRGGDYSASARLALKAYVQGKPMILSGKLLSASTSPSYWQENLFSNHYVWFTPLSKENKTRLEAKFEVPSLALEVSAWQELVTNKIYYDANSNVAQGGSNISVTGLYARKDFIINDGFHLDHRVLIQGSTDHSVIPLPLFSAFASYYYEFWVKKDVLRLQIGVDGRYTSSYYMPGYNPALSVFYNQNEVKAGNYPYMDFHITGKWKRMRILLKYQHLNYDMFGNNNYIQVANYPLNPGMFKLGISWGFYD